MTTELRRVIVSTADLTRSLAFYRDVLGLAGEVAAPFARLTAGDIEVMLHERPAVASDTSVSACFAIPDLDGTVARWSAGGGAVVDAPEDRPWGERMSVVRDPDGHLVCLVSA